MPETDQLEGTEESAPEREDVECAEELRGGARDHLRRAQALETAETKRLIRTTVEALPESQRAVITLRDIVGCTAAETCEALDITDANQRVLLHRARSRVRATLESAVGATVAFA